MQPCRREQRTQLMCQGPSSYWFAANEAALGAWEQRVKWGPEPLTPPTCVSL